jgi:hypothetical protein
MEFLSEKRVAERTRKCKNSNTRNFYEQENFLSVEGNSIHAQR